MKYALLISLAATVFATGSMAQPMYKCDNNYYTNTLPDAKAKGCKLMEGTNVTVVPGARPAVPAPTRSATVTSASPPGASSPAQRVESNDQKSRDSDARQILEIELKKAETRQAELLKEYNNGEPEKMGGEARNHQKYLDRVASLKASLARNESDIAGIRRELGRRGPSNAGAAAK